MEIYGRYHGSTILVRWLQSETEDALIEIIGSASHAKIIQNLWCLRQGIDFDVPIGWGTLGRTCDSDGFSWVNGELVIFSEAGDRRCSFRALTLRKIGSTCGADPSEQQEKKLWSCYFRIGTCFPEVWHHPHPHHPHPHPIIFNIPNIPNNSMVVFYVFLIFPTMIPPPASLRAFPEAGFAGLKASHGISEGALRECQEPKMTRYDKLPNDSVNEGIDSIDDSEGMWRDRWLAVWLKEWRDSGMHDECEWRASHLNIFELFWHGPETFWGLLGLPGAEWF